MDNELYELCKEVYGLFPEWKDTDKFYAHLHNRIGESLGIGITDEHFELLAPLYTSDYLLEKLPPVIFVRTSDGKNNTAILTLWVNGDKTVHVAYMIPYDEQNRGDYAQTSDTSRKALLMLTKALADAGELK